MGKPSGEWTGMTISLIDADGLCNDEKKQEIETGKKLVLDDRQIHCLP